MLSLDAWLGCGNTLPTVIRISGCNALLCEPMDRSNMTGGIEDYAKEHSLVKADDTQQGRPIYRRPGMGSVLSFEEMDESLSCALREARVKSGLTQAELAELIGLSTLVYSRYERAFSKLTATRLLHICELLDRKPHEFLSRASPSLWGSDEQEAEDRIALTDLSHRLPIVTVREILAVAKRLADLHEQIPAKHSTSAVNEA